MIGGCKNTHGADVVDASGTVAVANSERLRRRPANEFPLAFHALSAATHADDVDNFEPLTVTVDAAGAHNNAASAGKYPARPPTVTRVGATSGRELAAFAAPAVGYTG